MPGLAEATKSEKRKLMTTETSTHDAAKRAKTDAAPVAAGLWVQRTVAIGAKDKPAPRDSPATNGLWVKQSIAFAF
ncbi:hypothetical protein ACHHYP_13760 [Achlya hypogyna]|uniref:Uncharacterized protein n=1 Tax=Achlya hypogyna TaxID=1202772 RepID=A0A1V9ZFQ3_ACHHY|nr:hypothetical protein ACHHYP_13760 [Achlya hypogyna]